MRHAPVAAGHIATHHLTSSCSNSGSLHSKRTRLVSSHRPRPSASWPTSSMSGSLQNGVGTLTCCRSLASRNHRPAGNAPSGVAPHNVWPKRSKALSARGFGLIDLVDNNPPAGPQLDPPDEVGSVSDRPQNPIRKQCALILNREVHRGIPPIFSLHPNVRDSQNRLSEASGKSSSAGRMRRTRWRSRLWYAASYSASICMTAAVIASESADGGASFARAAASR